MNIIKQKVNIINIIFYNLLKQIHLVSCVTYRVNEMCISAVTQTRR